MLRLRRLAPKSIRARALSVSSSSSSGRDGGVLFQNPGSMRLNRWRRIGVAGIGYKFRRDIIRIQQPRAATFVIAKKLLVFCLSHIPCPYDFLLVDVCAVVNPIEQRIMIGAVSN